MPLHDPQVLVLATITPHLVHLGGGGAAGSSIGCGCCCPRCSRKNCCTTLSSSLSLALQAMEPVVVWVVGCMGTSVNCWTLLRPKALPLSARLPWTKCLLRSKLRLTLATPVTSKICSILR